MEYYNPDGPYVFQTGKRKGVSVESLMFNDYGFILFLLSKIRKEKKGEGEKNKLERHLEWIIARGEDRETEALCPQCKERRVRYFSVVYSFNDFSAAPYYTCCDNRRCIERLEGMAMKSVSFFPFKFSVLKRFRSKADKKRISSIFKWAFGLEPPLRKEKLFKFFSS